MWTMHESQCAKYVQSQQRKYKNHVQDIVLLFLLFRGVILRSQSTIYDGVFFAKVVNREEKKDKILPQGSRYGSKLWTVCTHRSGTSIVVFKQVIVDWVAWKVSTSFISTLIQISQILVLKKISNILMLKWDLKDFKKFLWQLFKLDEI